MPIMILNRLTRTPTGEEVQTILESLYSDDATVIDLDTMMTLIKYVIPVYPSLSNRSRTILLELVCSSFLFLAQLITFASNALHEKQTEVRLYREFIQDLLELEPACLYNYLIWCETFKTNGSAQVKSLFFGSKLFNLLSADIDIVRYLDLIQKQWQYIFDLDGQRALEVSQSPHLSGWLLASLSLHPTFAMDSIFAEVVLTNNTRFCVFKNIIFNSNPFDQRRLLTKFFIPYLQLIVNSENINEVKKIVTIFPLDKVVNIHVLSEINSPILQEIIVRSISKHISFKIFDVLISKFYENANTEQNNDHNICQIILMFLKYKFSKEEKNKLSHSSGFLDAITKRLEHNDREFRERTMYIAKKMSNDELKFESGFEVNIPDLIFEELPGEINFNKLKISDNTIHTIDKDIQMDSFAIKRLDLKDLQDKKNIEEEEEEEEDNMNRIVFVKDLMKEYEGIGKLSNISLISLLKHSIKLLRQKKYFPLEVNYYSTDLLSNIACLNNNLEEQDFEQWRINALVSVIVVVPEKVSELLRILFNSELSLQQRMSILSTLGLSARELRGFDDESIVKPEYNFPTSRLPWDTNSPLNGEPYNQHPIGNINSSIAQITPTTKNPIKEEQTIWKSKKLRTSDDTHPQGQTKRGNRFRTVAPQFFYPLVQGWLNGIDLGTYDKMFKSHYLTTIRIIYTCAYPVHEFDAMTEQLEQIMEQANQQGIPINK